jgi:hypothetical protein
MMKSLRLKDTAILLSVLTFATFIGRAALDFRFVFNDPSLISQDLGTTTAIFIFYMLWFTGWLWAHIKVERGSRTAWMWITIFASLVVLQSISTTLVFCPTPCTTAWPLAEVINWSNTVLGLPAMYSAFVQFRVSA